MYKNHTVAVPIALSTRLALWSAVAGFLLLLCHADAQTTSWKGTGNSSWNNAANWTAGVPTASTDAIIGDANFTGGSQPSVSSAATCKSLTLGAGIISSTLSVSKSLSVLGNLTIGANGTLTHSHNTLTVAGNWTNSGVYNGTKISVGVTFSGTSQIVGGKSATTFRKITINTGSTTTLATNVAIVNQLTVNGTLDPGVFTVSGNGALAVGSGGRIFVKASTLSGNYTVSLTLNGASTVEYGAAGSQTVDNSLTYGTLAISGGGIKTLAGNLPALNSAAAANGNINILAGTLDLSTFTASRGTTTTGGTLTLTSGAKLRIGGTGTFPANYATHTLASGSTVEYYGGNQTVSAENYFHLLLGASGASVKTMPLTAMSIGGSLISLTNAGGASVTFTSRAPVTVLGNLSLGRGTTFNGGSFTNTVGGNWTNNGTFAGNASTVTLSGTGASITGTGTNNFNLLTVTGAGITAASGTSFTVAGNLATSGAGTFTHTPGGAGTTTLSGAARTISGAGISFNNLSVPGSITTASSLVIAGNFTVGGSFSATAGTITLSGTGKTISAAGSLALSGLNVPGTITTANSFSVSSNVSVAGSFTATAGTATFNGTSTLSGTANLFNVTLNGTRLQLGSAAVLGIAGVFNPAAGTFDVTTTVPNTVRFNGGAQNIPARGYYNLSLAGTGAKTPAGALTVNGGLTISAGATFTAGTFTHSILGSWSNSGTFTAGAGTIQFLGNSDVSVSGANTFNILTVDKSNAANVVTLGGNATAATVNLPSGRIHTGTNILTITSTRTGSGIILGTITRAHAFSAGIVYAFESTNNTVTFNSLGSVSSVTETVGVGPVSDFPFNASLNRQYTLSVAASGPYDATLQLHYESAELNGNVPQNLQLWHNNGSWLQSGVTGIDATNHWTAQSGLADLNGRWTLADFCCVVAWNGSVSSAWEDPANWTPIEGIPTLPPSTNEIVQLGMLAFVNQPVLSSYSHPRSLIFGSAQAATLTLGAGAVLAPLGNVSGQWSNNITHTIDVGAQTFIGGGDLELSDGTNGHAINLSIGTGTVTVSGSLVESGDANITFTGSGTLNLNGDFNYTSGVFTPGPGTVAYTSDEAQVAAGVTYNQLVFNKTNGTATLATSATVNDSLTMAGNSTVTLNDTLTVAGNVTLESGTTLNSSPTILSVGGNWTNHGTFLPGSGTVLFNGSATQSIDTSTFNHLSFANAGGMASLAGNLSINGDLTIGAAGAVSLGSFTANRSAAGGALTLASGATLKTGGSFPANFATRSLASDSVVEYDGAAAQSVSAETYGHLILSHGGGNAKTLTGATTVAGDLLINSDAILDGGSATLTLNGNWTNEGAFTPATSDVLLAGAGKNLAGTNTFNDLTVSGSYTAAGNLTVNGAAAVTGSFAAGAHACTFAGDLNNSGSFTSAGTVTFAGTGVQLLALNSGFASTGTVNFNGSIAPAFTDSSSPALNNVNVANTSAVAPAVNWTVGGDFSVSAGATFVGGSATHAFYGNFNNLGAVISSGLLNFSPAAAATLNLRGTAFASTGTVIFGGTNALTLTGGIPSLNSVTIANTSASGVTPNGNWTVGGAFSITTGALFYGGAGLAHTLSGDIQVNGILSGGSSSFLLNGATALTGLGSITFGNLTITGGLTNQADANITGNFTNNGAFDSTGFDLAFTGSSAGTIAASATPLTIDSLVIAKSAATVSQSVNLSIGTSLALSGGTLDTGAFTVNQAAAGGSLTVGAGATLKLGGANPFPTYDTVALDPASTVEFAGPGSQTILAQNYGHLTSSSSGARTLASSGTIGVAGAFVPGANSYTVTGSTVNFNGAGSQTIAAFNYNNLTSSSSGARTLASSGTIGVAGAFVPGANSYTVTGSTVNFNGSAQAIPAFTYGSLSTGGSGAKTLGGNITVNGALHLLGGSFADGGFVATVNGDLASTVTHSGAGAILLSSGTTNHLVSGGGAFQNLTLADTYGALLDQTNLTVNGTLTLADGYIATGTNTVIIAAGGSVVRTNGYIFGRLQKNVATGATVRLFEIGDAGNYAPVSVAFGNVSTAGNLIAGTTTGNHPDTTNSSIQAARSVNRHWTLTNNGVAFDNCNATFNFNPTDISVGANPANFSVAKLTAGVWSLPSVGAKTATSIQATALTSFGDFQVGQSTAVPAILTQPVGQRGNLGSNFTFSAGVAGADPLSYQWRRNGSDISGATDSSYSIASALDLNAGTYSVLVTNLNGSDLSSNAVLTLNHPPVLTPIPNQVATTNVLLSVSTIVTDADGGTLTYALLTAPTGMTIHASGVITWTPAPNQDPSTNSVTVRVTDDGTPGLTDTKSFTVLVGVETAADPGETLALTNLGGGSFKISGTGLPGRTYRLQSTDSLSSTNWQDLPGGSVTANFLTGAFQYTDTSSTEIRFYRSVYP